MKSKNLFLVTAFFLNLGIFLFADSQVASASGPTYIDSSKITTPTTWNKAGSPYVIKASLTIAADLTIEPGTVIKVSGASSLHIEKDTSIKGSGQEKIVFTSFKDDSVMGDTNDDGNATLPAKSNWGGINVKGFVNFEMENVQISYAAVGLFISRLPYNPKNVSIRNSLINHNSMGIEFYRSLPSVEGNSILDNNVGIFVVPTDWWGSNAQAHNNSIVGNLEGVRVYSPVPTYGGLYMDAKNNWWGDKSGPYFKHAKYGNDNLGGMGNSVSDGVLFDPWLGKDPTVEEAGCQENCFSNVMFLPGIKSSRLYKDGAMGTEDKLWPPNYLGNDLEDLTLDENGNSVENVYTKDVLDEVAIPHIGGNIYKTFLGKMADLKSDGTIDDYETFAYDWRQNVEDIAKNGTPYSDGMIKSAVSEIIALATSSKSQKVTIIAHSNGGLIAKAAMLELEKQGLTDKVDKIVFVGTPQMGTPLALLSMLYGYDEAALFGTLISRSESRELAENMPGAYGLLPSEKYFERMESPFVDISSLQTRYEKFANAYGENMDSFDEFKNFLLGKTDGREKPESEEVEKENILNEKLLNQATEMHQRLDAWTPPANIEVIQIAGWGLDTVSGVEYAEKEKVQCYIANSKIPSCIGMGEYEPVYEPKFTVDGDKVVVASSALMLVDAENVEKYWVDLYGYNNNNAPDRQHKNILEINSIQQFLVSVITNNSGAFQLPEFIKASRPNDYNNAKPRLRMSLYSPLDIHLYDDAGNHTGPKKITIDGQEHTVFEEGIPSSYYYQFGERKYVGFGIGEYIHAVLDGYALGSYTLKLEEVKATESGEEIISHTTFENLPTTADTTVLFDFPATGLANMTTLQADVNGDGKNDYKIDKVLNGTAILDTVAPEIKIMSHENDRQYLNNQILKFEYSVADNISALEKIQTEILYDGKPLENKEIDLSLQDVGGHEFSISAVDETGNIAKQKIDFSYVTNIEAISNNIDHYAQLNLIADAKTRDFMQVKMDELAHIQDMIAKMDSKGNIDPKANQIKLLNKKIDDLVGFIQGKLKDTILSPAREILIQSLNYVKI